MAARHRSHRALPQRGRQARRPGHADNGFGWDRRALPASSDELVEAQGRYYRHTIECFGPQRCMFESNFPVDRRSLPYASYWNAMKKIAQGYSEGEQEAMFWGTAERVYGV